MVKFLNTAEDTQWLRDTHLPEPSKVPAFASFILWGNEDAPYQIELYASVDPLFSEKPVYTLIVCDECGDYRPVGGECAACAHRERKQNPPRMNP